MRPGDVIKPGIPTVVIAPLVVGYAQSRVAEYVHQPEALTTIGYGIKVVTSGLVYGTAYWVMNRRTMLAQGRGYIQEAVSLTASGPGATAASLMSFFVVGDLLTRSGVNPFISGSTASVVSSLAAIIVMATTAPKINSGITRLRKNNGSIDTLP